MVKSRTNFVFPHVWLNGAVHQTSRTEFKRQDNNFILLTYIIVRYLLNGDILE